VLVPNLRSNLADVTVFSSPPAKSEIDAVTTITLLPGNSLYLSKVCSIINSVKQCWVPPVY